MRNMTIRCLALLAAGLIAAPMWAQAKSDDPLNDPEVQKILRGMADASTWYHPDLFGEFAGMRRYAHHDYAGALKFFKIGAYYSDKLSALSIGMMYLNGEGVAKDPVKAYAWLVVAAERDYPDFISTRDRVKASLTPVQLQQAQPIVDEIAAKYGDKVAKHRLIVQLNQGRMNITGSHTGFDSGIVELNTGHCGGPSVEIGGEAMPKAGCGGNVFAKWRWDPKTYFAVRDSRWKATVSVGAIKDAPEKDSGKPPQDESAVKKP